MTQNEVRDKTKGFFSVKRNRVLILSAFFIASFGSLCAKVVDLVVPIYYPDRPIPVDLIHDLTPYIQPLEYVSDIVLIIMVVLFVYYLVKYKEEEGAFQLINIATMYIIRAFLNLVTPLGKPLGNESSHGIFKEYAIQYGMFPSGHIGLTFYMFLAIDPKYKMIKVAMLVLFIIELVTMLLSRGHFSIDVFGAMILSYAIHKFYLGYKDTLLFELPK